MVNFQDVLQASETLRNHIVRTPVVRAVGLYDGQLLEY